jgi:hypothetical protein
MNKLIESNIAQYITYFRDQVSLVEDHCPKSRDGDLHSRILYIAILDAISKLVFEEKTNRDRMVKFISDFCDWPDCNRVSLTHLSQLVKNSSEPELVLLKDFVIKSMSNWLWADKILLNRDPDVAEVEKVWPQVDGKLKKINGVKLNQLQHCRLLYTYRNSLVHEFKTTGYHVELWKNNEPYYASMTMISDDVHNPERSWQLQYTVAFFKRFCFSGLSNLENYLVTNKIDPLKVISQGSYWIKELNF